MKSSHMLILVAVAVFLFAVPVREPFCFVHFQWNDYQVKTEKQTLIYVVEKITLVLNLWHTLPVHLSFIDCFKAIIFRAGFAISSNRVYLFHFFFSRNTAQLRLLSKVRLFVFVINISYSRRKQHTSLVVQFIHENHGEVIRNDSKCS